MGRRVLIITYYWPPSGGIAVLRWLKMARHLKQAGWEPVIYTVANGDYPSLDAGLAAQVPTDMEVIRQPIWEPYSWYRRFLGLRKDTKIQTGMLSEGKKSSFKEYIARWVRGNLFIPDARCFWIRPSVRYLHDYLQQHPVDAIVSNGPPHSVHLIALGIKRSLGIPWVADFRDPWTNIDFYHKLELTRWGDARHRRLEQQVMQHADLVTTVSWTWAEEFKQLGARRVEVVNNAFDEEDFPAQQPELLRGFTLTHTGSLNSDRNPQILWRALRDLALANPQFSQDLHLRFIGATDLSIRQAVATHGLEGNVTYINQLSHQEALQALLESPLLLLPLNDTPNVQGIIPGKVYEYLASGRPMLAIGPPDGDTARIIRETGAGDIYAFDDEAGLRQGILQWYKRYREGTLTGAPKENITAYSRRRQAEKMAQLISQLLTTTTT